MYDVSVETLDGAHAELFEALQEVGRELDRLDVAEQRGYVPAHGPLQWARAMMQVTRWALLETAYMLEEAETRATRTEEEEESQLILFDEEGYRSTVEVDYPCCPCEWCEEGGDA